jgi:hypothetical protein
MGKTHSKPLTARHGRGTAWARHAMCESAFSGTARQGNGMGTACCVNRPLAARHGRGTAWARHAMCESAFSGTA